MDGVNRRQALRFKLSLVDRSETRAVTVRIANCISGNCL
jgi:hypothetical protein